MEDKTIIKPVVSASVQFLDITSLKSRIDSVASSIEAKRQSIAESEFLISVKKQEILQLQNDNEVLQKTMTLFKTLSEQENEKSKDLFISLINYGLDSVFGTSVKFDLERKQYATGTFYFPYLLKDGKKENIFSSGGGILDIVSFLCRIVVLVSFYNADARVLRLDEPFKNLSAEYRSKAIELMSALSEQFSIQIIMVTHLEEFMNIENSTIFKTSKHNQTTSYQKFQQ